MEFSLIQIFAFIIVGFFATSYGVLVGAGGGFIDLYGYPYCRGRVFNDLEKDLEFVDSRTIDVNKIKFQNIFG